MNTSFSEEDKKNIWKHQEHLRRLLWLLDDIYAKPMSIREQHDAIVRAKECALLAVQRFGKVESNHVSPFDRMEFSNPEMRPRHD